MSAHHHHGHHDHRHPPANHDRSFAIGAALNLAFVLVEFGAGFTANSVALMADAAHNLGDVLMLLLGWGAAWLVRRPPTARRTYGWGRSSILAALANAAVLLIGVGGIGVEAIRLLFDPRPVASGIVMAVAAAGILVNGGTALLFLRGREQDMNIRAQFLHLGGDAAISLGVALAAAAIYFTGLNWLDPAVSVAIAALIALSTWTLLREAVDLAMDAAPAQFQPGEVSGWLAQQDGVTEVHDLHIWALSTTETALTAHLVYAEPTGARNMTEVSAALRRRFGIGHATLQAETSADAEHCRLRPDHII
jgi:cobalt-zinc-cadmium efflux system protein